MSHGKFWSAASALATIAASLITALSLLFLVIQLREQRRYTLAEFVNGLGKEFAEFDDVFEVLLLHGDGPTPELTPELHQEKLLRCLRFFERVKTLSDVGVLDAKVLDGMFGPQFFWLVNDAWIQERVLFEGEHFFPEIFALHQQLSACRKRSGREVPAAASDLALKDPGGTKETSSFIEKNIFGCEMTFLAAR
jgi:hypothetical protein